MKVMFKGKDSATKPSFVYMPQNVGTILFAIEEDSLFVQAVDLKTGRAIEMYLDEDQVRLLAKELCAEGFIS